MTVTYDNIDTEIQNVVYTIINTSTDITAQTTNIMDGMPTALMNDTGYPHILIHHGKSSLTHFKDNNSLQSNVRLAIDIYTTQERIASTLISSIKKLLIDSQTIFDAAGLVLIEIEDDNRDDFRSQNDRVRYFFGLELSFRWSGRAS